MADGWEAFTAAPAATAPAAVVAAPSSDGWAAFTAPAAAPEAPASFPVVAPRFLEPHEAGYKPGSMTNMSPEDWAKFSAGEAPTTAAVQSTEPASAAPSSPGKTGIVANLGAGGNAAVAGTLGLPVDLVTGGINLATRGINAGARALGYGPTPSLSDLITDKPAPDLIPPITDPFGGSGTFKRAMGVVGANPDDVRPDGLAQEVARGVGGGVVSSLIPTGAVSGLVRGGVMAAETAPRVLSALGGPTAANVGLGATSGAASEAAASQVPDAWKPLVGMGAGLGVVGIPAALWAGGRAAVNALTDYAAPAVGRAAPVLDASGAVITDANGAPINMLSNVADSSRAPGPVAATPNQARMAGQRLNALASNPDAVQARLAQQGPPAMGDNPTTAQLTADPGLLAAERGLSRTVPGAQREYIKQAGQANDARVQGLQGVAEGGIPAKASDLIQRQASDADVAATQQMAALRAQTAADVARTEASGQQRAAGLQQSADQARDAVGGNLPAGSEAQVGGNLRAPLDAANRSAKARETALWEAIDPDGTLAVDMTPIKKGAAEILREMSPNADPMEGKEAAIFDTAKGLPSVQSFRDLAALRSRLTTAIRQERGPNGNPEAVRRLSMLLGYVEKAMASAVESAPEAAVTAPRPNANTVAGSVPSTGTKAYTPSGQAVDVRYGVREAADLTPSQLPDGRPNPAFPQELQPRDRTRAASLQQVNSMANRLNPELLGASASTAEGAPIIGADGIVESGNGRIMAIQKAYANGGPQADAYRQWVASQGHDVSGMQAPVLVRERTTPMTMAERAKFADDAGASPVLSMSASERASADAKRIPADTLSMLRSGDVTSPRNADFARAFAQHVVPEGEHAGFMTADGEISAEGADRMRNALVQRAYGSNSLVSAMAEHADSNIKAFGGALVDAAGSMAKLRGAIETGTVDKSLDLSSALVEAANLIQQRQRAKLSLADMVAQRDAFSTRGEMVETILRAAYGDDLKGVMSRSKLASLLADYADNAQVQSGLFGDNKSAAVMFGEAEQKYGYGTKAAAGGRTVSRTTSGNGPSVGIDRPQVHGSGDGSPGTADAIPGNDGSAAASVPTAAPLTANFDEAARARYDAARQATATRKDTFNTPPGVKEAMQGGPISGSFRLPDSSVPATIIRTGPEGAPRVKAYLAAGGSPEALSEAAAFSLRNYAKRADGTIDPAKYATWAKDRASFLSALPDAAGRFGAAAEAQRAADTGAANAAQTLKDAVKTAQQTVDDAAAAQADRVRDYQRSALGKFVPGSDPVAVVSSILRDPKMGRANMAQVVYAVKADPDALEALQRTVIIDTLARLQGNSVAAGGTEAALKSDQFQTFLRTREPALREVLTDQQMATLQRTAESLQRSNLSVAGSKLAGGSDTEQIRNAGAHATTLMGRFTSHVTSNIGTGIGGAIGFVFGGGPLGAMAGAGAGKMGDWAAQSLRAAREAGMHTVDDLVANAVLHPQLYAVLTANVTPANEAHLMRAFVSQLQRISLVSTAVGAQSPSMPQQPKNRLLH